MIRLNQIIGSVAFLAVAEAPFSAVAKITEDRSYVRKLKLLRGQPWPPQASTAIGKYCPASQIYSITLQHHLGLAAHLFISC